MFRKLLNVGKGHSASNQEKLQQQQQQKNLFQLNEIRSYGFSHLCCLGYSPTLSLLAVGSKFGLLRVLGNSSVEFSYQLETGNAIRQIEFIDCRKPEQPQQHNSSANNKKSGSKKSVASSNASSEHLSTVPAKHEQQQQQNPSAKIVVLTDNGQLHLFELKTCKQLNFADNTTQTDGNTTITTNNTDCCQQQKPIETSTTATTNQVPEYTRLEFVASLDYFKHKPDLEDRSKRVTTFEISADSQTVFVGTEGGNVYLVPLNKFYEQVQQQQQADQQETATTTPPSATASSTTATGVVSNSGKRSVTPSQAAAAATATEVQTTDSTANGNNKSNSKASLKKDESLGGDEPETAVNLSDEPQIDVSEETQDGDDADAVVEPFELIKFEEHILPKLGDDIKSKKQGAVESIKKHPASNGNKTLLLISYHRGLNVIYNVQGKNVDKYFYHNQVLESSCFADQSGDFFYTSHNDGSYIRWETRQGSQAKANEDLLGQLYGPYPCKPTPKIQACTGLANDQLEELIIFSGGMPRATYDDKNPVTIVKAGPDGKDTIKTVLDFTSKVLDFAVITRPRGNLGAGAKSTGGGGGGSGGHHQGGGGGKKNKHKHQQQQKQEQKQQEQRNQPIAVALAILAEEEFVVIDLLNSESYLEFCLPYLNCVHSSAITCNQHYSDISDDLYNQLLVYNKQQLRGKLSTNEWPITGGKVIDAPELKSHDILLTGHEDGSVNFWDVSDLSMRHLLHLTTARLFSTNDDLLDAEPLPTANGAATNKETTSATNNDEAAAGAGAEQDGSAWPPLKRVGRFDPYSDDTRLAIRRLSLCPQTGTLVVAGTGGQVLAFELKEEASELESLVADEITIVADQRFTWKGREKLGIRAGSHKFSAGYQLSSFVQCKPPVAPTSLDIRSDWSLYALGTSYGFYMYDYAAKRAVVTKCTLNVQDFAMVSGDATGAGAMSRKKSFRKSLRESFRRLRRGRSQRHPQPTTGTTTTTTGPVTTGPATTNTSSSAAGGAASATDGQSAAAKPAFARATTGVRTLSPPSLGGGGGGGGQASRTPDASTMAAAAAAMYSNERQVELKVELSSIVKCITLTPAVITSTMSFKPTLWVGTNSGQVLVYAIELASEQQQQQSDSAKETSPETQAAAATGAAAISEAATGEQQQQQQQAEPEAPQTTARLAKEIQLKHKAPIIAIFTSPEAPPPYSNQEQSSAANESAKSTPVKQASELALLNKQSSSDSKDGQTTDSGEGERAATPAETVASKSATSSPSKSVKHEPVQQPRVLICSEEQFKVFNLPNLKPFCKFKLTAHEGLRAKKISITQFLKPASNSTTAAAAAAATKATTNLPQQQQQQLQQQPQLTSSKSLQSFATQTSPSASPMPPADSTSQDDSGKPISASENNNNSLSALNNNSSSSSSGKEIMNAKFGAKSSSATVSETAATTTKQELAEQQQVEGAGQVFEPYMVCMSNQGDCAIYSVPDLKRQAQIQVCKREDVNGITSTMLTNYGEGYYLKSSSNFLRFSISSQRVPRILSVV